MTIVDSRFNEDEEPEEEEFGDCDCGHSFAEHGDGGECEFPDCPCQAYNENT